MSGRDRQYSLGDAAVDDLPRTLRREREARERNGQSVSAAPSPSPQVTVPERDWSLGATPQPAVVTQFQVPFLRLMMFMIKAVLASIPALILLGAMLWVGGYLLMTYFPWLVQVKIQIYVPH